MADERPAEGGPPKRKRTAYPQLPLEERQRRFRLAEELLSRVFSERRVEAELVRQVPCGNGAARRLIDHVKASWLAASCEDPDVRRSRLRAAAEAVYTACMTRTEIVLDHRGRPLLDPATKRPLREPAPDTRTASGALSFLARLDGLMLQAPEEGTFLTGLTAVIDATRRSQVIDATPRLGNGTGNEKANGSGNGHAGSNGHGNEADDDEE